MAAVITLLTVLTLSLLTVRVATVALILTGTSRSLARFQARSAFTGCGFTTLESEQMVNHPVRRRIILTLMLLGNAGIVTTAGAVVAGITYSGETAWLRLPVLAAGLGALWLVTNSTYLDRLMSRWIAHLLKKYSSLDARDYANLLHISGEYGLGELLVEEGDWIAGRSLKDLKLPAEGVLVLGVNRGKSGYVGAPRSGFVIRPGDELVLYGATGRIRELDERARGVAGALAHADAVAEFDARSREENADAEAGAALDDALQQLEAARPRRKAEMAGD